MKQQKSRLAILVSTETFIKPFKKQFSEDFKLSWWKIPYTPPPKRLMDYLVFPYKLMIKKIKTLMSLIRSEIVFVEFANETLALASKWKGKKTLVTRLHRYELFQLPKAKWDAVDAIIVVNQRMKERLEEKLPEMEGKIHCVPNYLDIDYWTPKENRTKTNQIAIVGSIEPRKGHDKAIVAFSKIVKKYPDLRLNIIGINNDKEFSNTLVRLAEDLKLRNKIRFLGFSNDIKKDFQDTDIILSFSEHESTHLTLFEGLSCGAWPLSTTWDGVKEFLPNENLFSDDNEFIKKVKKFYSLTDEERIEKIDKLAKERLVKFTKPDPRKEISELILKTHKK
tara:strand:- start:272 stop:1282 length:1011 start_codon:yes stop_codon:yes gene_type:complete